MSREPSAHGHAREGVTKFSGVHAARALSAAECHDVGALDAWRSIVVDVGGIGQVPDRYDGIGFGNMSVRLGPFPGGRGRRRFLITGTQTGHLRTLAARHFSGVDAYDFRAFQCMSAGEVAPSSESLTHAAVYDESPTIRVIIHAHQPEIFAQTVALKVPTTSAHVDYGTPEMVDEVRRVFRETRASSLGVFAMGGHQDGVVFFGRTLDDVGARFISTLARARALTSMRT